MTAGEEEIFKNQQLRNNEYYDTQTVHDLLYIKSKEQYKFKNLIDLVLNESNIKLAYRNIKTNKGSKTKGTNNHTIKDIEKYEISEWSQYIKERLVNFKPMPVKRVEIPKPNGGTRPLGIPTIEDRMIQQCFKQILEPIVEAKFYHGSYGFRPDRSAENAMASVMKYINLSKLHYAVDIDIKGFFDNINHGKLIKQMWTMGIRDKKLIVIISKMLKAEIEGIGIPEKGTPQGGIISTLLSNIVLNELDWWIYSQWEGIKTKEYANQSNRYRALKQTNLKKMYIVRYADDFKILTDSHESAQKIFIAVRRWLKERLKLDISTEKSQVINLRKNYSDFLGFKIKAIKKKEKKYTARVCLSEKSKNKIKQSIKEQIKNIRKNTTKETVYKLNSMILGWHNYYKIATNVNLDFNYIHFTTRQMLFNRTKEIRSDTKYLTETLQRYYGSYYFKSISICKITLYPVYGVKFVIPKLTKSIGSRYCAKGRYFIHKELKTNIRNDIKYLIDNPLNGESLIRNDNRISVYVAQYGLCYISKEKLELEEMVLRNKIQLSKDDIDKYQNLVIINRDINDIIEETDIIVVKKYLETKELDKKAITRINILRKFVGNQIIEY